MRSRTSSLVEYAILLIFEKKKAFWHENSVASRSGLNSTYHKNSRFHVFKRRHVSDVECCKKGLDAYGAVARGC